MDNLELHRPTLRQQFFEKLRLRSILPEDICPADQMKVFAQQHPELFADPHSFDLDNGVYAGANPGWWKSLLNENGQTTK